MTRTGIFFCALVPFCLCLPVWPQSVADAAAASRASNKVPAKVITNDDVKPAEPADADDSDGDSASNSPADKHERRAAQIKNRVLRLKQQIAAHESRLIN